MSVLTKGTRFSSAFISVLQKRCFHHFELKTIRCTFNLREKNVICHRKIPVFGQQDARQFKTYNDRKGLIIIRQLNKRIKQGMQITEKDVYDCFNAIELSEDIKSSDMASILKFTGKCLDVEGIEERQEILLKTWGKIKKIAKLDAVIFNALISMYAENEMQSAWQDVLKEMTQCGVEPNKETFFILLRLYCTIGDIKTAKELINMQMEKGLPQTVQIYNSLMIGLSKLEDIDGMLQLYQEMQLANVTPNAETFAILLPKFVLSDPGQFDELMENVEKGELLFTPMEVMEIVKPLLKKEDEEKAMTVMKSLPRVTNKRYLQEAKKMSDSYDSLFWAFPEASGLFKQLFDENMAESFQISGILPPVVDDVEETSSNDLIQSFYDNNFEKLEGLLLQIDLTDYEYNFHVISCLVQYYSVHKKDLETVKDLWKSFTELMMVVVERVTIQKKHGVNKLSQLFRNITMQPVVDFCVLLMENKDYDEVVKVLDFAEMIPTCRLSEDLVDFRPLLHSCLCHSKGNREENTYKLTGKVERITDNIQNQNSFMTYLIDKYPKLAMDHWWYIAVKKRKIIAPYSIFTYLIKEKKHEELMDAIEKVYEHDKTDTILPTMSLAAAYITNGKKKVAIKVIEKSDIIISQTNEESMKVLEGLFHSISKDPNSADVLQDIIEVTQQMIPQELHIRLNLILAKFYAAQEMFDKSTTLLENCYKKSSDVILEKCGDIIGHIKQQFEMKNEPLPEKLRQSEESENIENLCKTFPRMSGLEAYHWIKHRVDEENTDILIELIKKLVDRDEVPVDLIFIMGRVLKRKGRPDVIISLSDMLSDIFPREFKEGFRRNIPFAYYHDRNVLNYIDQVQYNDYRVDSCEISPELLVFLAEKGSIGFEKFLSLAEDENCLHQAAVCNALFCYYLNSDIEQAEFYFRKIPETWTLSHLKFALTQVFTSAKPENIDLFWDLVENRLIKQDYIKNRIISFYLTQKMLGKALNHFYDAVEKNITVYAKNAQFILFLCEKTGTNVPEEVMLIIENASLEPNLVAEQQNLDAEQPDLDAEHLDLDAEQPNLDAEHLDLDAEQPNLDAEQKNLDAEQLDLAAEQSNLDAEQKNLDTEQLDLDAEQSNLDAELPDLDAEQPNLDAEHLDLDAEQKNLDAEQLDLDGEQSNLDAKQPDLDAEWTNLDAEQPNLDAEQPDLDAELKDLDAEQPYLDAKRKSLDAKHPYLDVEQPYLDARKKGLDAEEKKKRKLKYL